MPDFTTGTSSALEKEITLLLGGVGTAFYVSIYGIFLSIWWIFFEKIGMTRFEHDCFIIKENTKSFFWTKIDIESIHIRSNLDNFAKMTEVFEQITSSDILESLNSSITHRVNIIEEILQKELKLSANISENIQNSEELTKMVKEMSSNISINIQNYEKQKEIHDKSSDVLNSNVEKLNETLQHLSSDNLQDVYTNIVKSIDTMKNEVDRIGWRFNKQLDEYDTKFTDKLKNSLESIDNQTNKTIEDLEKFKKLSK